MKNTTKTTDTPIDGYLAVMRCCSFCQNYCHEEIGDSDFGGVYAPDASCSKYLDVDQETEEDIENFDRNIDRDCCQLDFWYVLECDKTLKEHFDNEMDVTKGCSFDKTYKLFKERYNGA